MNVHKKNLLSKEGYDKLVRELKELKQSLSTILERLSEAKAMGDLSENFEYKSAMEEKDFINSRISEIEMLLADAEIVEKKQSKSKKDVDFGSKVTLSIEGDDKEYKVMIVGTAEVGIDEGIVNISFESPLGQAIKGKKVGETSKMKHDNGKKEIKILAIE